MAIVLVILTRFILHNLGLGRRELREGNSSSDFDDVGV